MTIKKTIFHSQVRMLHIILMTIFGWLTNQRQEERSENNEGNKKTRFMITIMKDGQEEWRREESTIVGTRKEEVIIKGGKEMGVNEETMEMKVKMGQLVVKTISEHRNAEKLIIKTLGPILLNTTPINERMESLTELIINTSRIKISKEQWEGTMKNTPKLRKIQIADIANYNYNPLDYLPENQMEVIIDNSNKWRSIETTLKRQRNLRILKVKMDQVRLENREEIINHTQDLEEIELGGRINLHLTQAIANNGRIRRVTIKTHNWTKYVKIILKMFERVKLEKFVLKSETRYGLQGIRQEIFRDNEMRTIVPRLRIRAE